MRCPHCEAALPARSRFCLSCGKPVEILPAANAGVSDRTAVRSAPARGEGARTPGGERPRDVRGVIFAVVAAFALVLGSFTWVLTRQTPDAGSVVAQISPRSGNVELRGLPEAGSGLTNQPRLPSSQGPGVTAQPAPQTRGPAITRAPEGAASTGPSALNAPNTPTGGPNVLGAPSRRQGGPAITGTMPNAPSGPSLLRGPNAPSSGPPLAAAPNSPPTGPPLTTQPAPPSEGPPVVANPPPTPERRPEPPKEDITPYLRRLERFERQRVTFEAQMVAIVSSTMLRQAMSVWMEGGEGQPQFAMQTVRAFDQIAGQYLRLTTNFQGYVGKPPVSCRQLHVEYATALSIMPRIVMALRRAIVYQDLGTVSLVQQLGSPELRMKFAEADRQLGLVTSEHNLPKWFSLGSGGGSSGLFSWFMP